MVKSGVTVARKDLVEVLVKRPTEDQAIEQFLMPPRDVIKQGRWLAKFFHEYGLIKPFLLGDDDHVSLPTCILNKELRPVVLEYDERIISSIGDAALQFGITEGEEAKERIQLEKYDAHQPVPEHMRNTCDSFYLNPPYSSRSMGLGLTVWLQRAWEACGPDALGVLAVPWSVDGAQPQWITNVHKGIDSYITEKGFSLVKQRCTISCSYPTANDPKLRSRNIVIATPSAEAPKNIVFEHIYNYDA